MAADRRGDRQAALRTLLASRGLGALVVAHLPNVRYLTGFSGTSALLLLTEEDAVLFSDFRYQTQASAEVGGGARVEIVERDLWGRLGRLVRDGPDIGVLGFEAHVVTAEEAHRLKEAVAPRDVRPAGELVEVLRATKDAGEIRAIRAAAELACQAFWVAIATVRPGMRELDVAARLEDELRRRGSEWHPFPTIVASGPRAALPHAGTSTRAVQAGEFLLLDFGARVDGYCADITRTVVVGRTADQRQRTVYDLVREAQQQAVRGIRGGLSGREADGLARGVIETGGCGEAFGHSLGHGLGLEVHEAPRVSRANEETLPVGAVVTVEPGVYFPGWGGIRLEDDVLLAEDGAELLSDGRTELVEIT